MFKDYVYKSAKKVVDYYESLPSDLAEKFKEYILPDATREALTKYPFRHSLDYDSIIYIFVTYSPDESSWIKSFEEENMKSKKTKGKKKNTVNVKNGTDLEQLFPMNRNDIPIGPQNERSGSGKIASVEVGGKTFELEMTTEENDEYWNIYGGGDDGEYYSEEDASITYEIIVKYNDNEVASDVFYYNPMVDKETYNKLYKDIVTLIKDNSGSLNESKTTTTIYSKFL